LIEGQGQQMALKRSLLTGISSLFVKSSENDGLIYSCMCIAFPSLIEAHGFVTANVNEKTSLFIPARASILGPKSIQIESNQSLSAEGSIHLHSHWSDKK